MANIPGDPELSELIRRFLYPDRRYLRLGGNYLRLTGSEREQATRGLAQAAAQITDAELTVLLDRGGWRERKTAAWLIAASRRTGFRARLGELLLASEGPYAGAAYCVALASFATEADARLLCNYLDRYLLRPDLGYDQPVVLGALLYLDGELGTAHAAAYLAPGGLWEQWEKAAPNDYDPQAYRRTVAAMRAFAADSAPV